MSETDADRSRIEALEAALVSTQEKLLFVEQTAASLSDALTKKELALHALEERVHALEAAIRTLAQRGAARADDDIANAEEDPVPSSG